MSNKVLIVDDDEDILELMEYNLSNNGYEVVTAGNGIEGFEKAIENNPDLIILDVMMPELDGVSLCEKLRAESQFTNTVIVFLTARSEDFTQISCYESGGDDFIVKPIKPKVLLSRIKALLKRSARIEQEKTSNLIEIKDLLINLDEFTVQKGKQSINLVKKEFKLLVLLASKPGKLYTRDEIFNKIWGTDVIVGDRTIDVHIRKIREKLGDNYIKTIKGMGYKFENQE